MGTSCNRYAFELEVVENAISFTDNDSDGLYSSLESDLGTSDSDLDSDDDLMPDGWEYVNELNPNYSSDNSIDSDNDGLSNFEEYNYTLHNSNVSYYTKIGLNPQLNDTDFDGISDFDEINGTLGNVTDPVSIDTDDDGMLDKWEFDYGLQPIYDDSGGDLDSDGVNNTLEFVYRLDPTDNDTDNDGLNDSETIYYGTSGSSNDTDNDGISDYDEIMVYFTDPLSPDTDLDYLTDYQEIFTYNSNATNNDTDGDGMIDGWEVNNSLNLTNSSDASIDSESDGIINLYEFGNSTDPWDNDTDNDNLSDYIEIVTYETDPTSNDTDSDGLTDYQEINGISPNYFTSNPLSNDTDGDNVYDYDEVMKTYDYYSDPNDTNSDTDSLNDYVELITYGCDPMNDDTDGDGLDDDTEVLGTLGYYTDPTDEDTDDDHWTDELEINCVTNPTSSGSTPVWNKYATSVYSWHGDSLIYINDDNALDCLLYEDSKTIQVKDQYTKQSYLSLVTSGFGDLPEGEMFQSPHPYIDKVRVYFKTKFYNSVGHYSNTDELTLIVHMSSGNTYSYEIDNDVTDSSWYESIWTITSGGVLTEINDDYEYVKRVEIRVETGENWWGYSAIYVDYLKVNYEVYQDSP